MARLLIAFLLVMVGILAFSPSVRTKYSKSVLRMASSKVKHSYNDDAFGGVFLTGLLVSSDYIFAGTYTTLSFIAAAARKRKKEEGTQWEEGRGRETDSRETLTGGFIGIGLAEKYLLPPIVAVNALITASILSLT